MQRSSTIVDGLMVGLACSLLACSPAEPGPAATTNPVETLASPISSWTFDDCEADPEWTYSVATEGSNEEWVTMTPFATSNGGCAAKLDFRAQGASVAMDPTGLEGDGFGLSLQAKFVSSDEPFNDVTTTWTLALASKETGDGDPDKLWKYAIEAVLTDGVLSLSASGYRESPWGGADLSKVTVTATPGSIALDQWVALSIVVDRKAGTISLWVDGERQGTASFTYETFDHIDRFAVKSEALRPETYFVNEGEDGERYRQSELHVDNVGLYALDATQLEALAQ